MTKLGVRLALGGMTGCVTATALYALLRSFQFFFRPEPNPALVIWSAHSGYFWRALTCGYVGGMAAILGFLASARRPEQLARGLVTALSIAIVLIVLQGALLP